MKKKKGNLLKKVSTVALAGFLVFAGGHTLKAQADPDNFKIGEKFNFGKASTGDKAYIIDYKFVDVTGDKVQDDVILVGDKFNKNDIFADNLTIVVQDGKTEEFSKVLYKNFAGYEGKLFVGDFSGDKVNDVMVSAATGGSGGIVEHLIATFKDNKSQVIFTEKENDGAKFKGTFVDDFKAELVIENLNKKVSLDLSANKDMYIKQGIYDKAGKLLKETMPWSYPFGKLEPVDYNADGTYELKGAQRVIGAYNADTISRVDSLWKFENSQWNLEELQYSTFLLK